MSDVIRLVIVDDHTIVRQALRSILELERGIEVVGEAGDGATALQVIETHQPDIVLLDLSLGGREPTGGLTSARRLSAHSRRPA